MPLFLYIVYLICRDRIGELQPWAKKSQDNEQKPSDAATYVGYANSSYEMNE